MLNACSPKKIENINQNITDLKKMEFTKKVETLNDMLDDNFNQKQLYKIIKSIDKETRCELMKDFVVGKRYKMYISEIKNISGKFYKNSITYRYLSEKTLFLEEEKRQGELKWKYNDCYFEIETDGTDFYSGFEFEFIMANNEICAAEGYRGKYTVIVCEGDPDGYIKKIYFDEEEIIERLKKANREKYEYNLKKIPKEYFYNSEIQDLVLEQYDVNDGTMQIAKDFARGGKEIVDPLMKKYNDKKLSIMRKRGILITLGLIGDKRTTDIFIKGLYSKDNEIRQASSYAFYKNPDIKIINHIANSLLDKDKDVRQNAIFAICKIKDKKVMIVLKKATQHYDEFVAEVAQECIEERKSEKE